MVVINSIAGSMIFFLLVFIFRKYLVKKLLQLKNKLFFQSLRKAIGDADKDKNETGCKNIVIYNTDKKEFEPVQKKLLKRAASAKVQDKVPAGFRQPKAKKAAAFTAGRVRKIEKKSLYVTE